jgi:hypothetical protein
MRGPSTADCEKSFQRTGLPSANMLRRAGAAYTGPLIQIQTLANQPLANQPLANQPLANQPLANQPLANQPLANQALSNSSPIALFQGEDSLLTA